MTFAMRTTIAALLSGMADDVLAVESTAAVAARLGCGARPR